MAEMVELAVALRAIRKTDGSTAMLRWEGWKAESQADSERLWRHSPRG